MMIVCYIDFERHRNANARGPPEHFHRLPPDIPKNDRLHVVDNIQHVINDHAYMINDHACMMLLAEDTE